MGKTIREKIENNYFLGAQQSKEEMLFIYDIVEELGITDVLEIGTGCGAFTTLLAMAGCAVITVDIRPEPVNPWWIYKKETGEVGELPIQQLIGDSGTREMYDKIVAIKDRFDLVIIDGDHYEGGEKDWHLYKGLAPVIAIHDIAKYDQQYYHNENWFPHYFWKWLKDGNYFDTKEMSKTPNNNGGWGVIFK